MSVEEEIAQLKKELAEERAEKAQLRQQLEEALARLSDLERRLAKDSHNSSKPPSSDGTARKWRSQRKASGKKTGGQPGHSGHSLQLVAASDEIVRHRPTIWQHCQQELAGVTGQVKERRQVLKQPTWHNEYPYTSRREIPRPLKAAYINPERYKSGFVRSSLKKSFLNRKRGQTMAYFQLNRNFAIPDNTEGQGVQVAIPADKELLIELISGFVEVPSTQSLNGVLQILSPDTMQENGIYAILGHRAGTLTPGFDLFLFSQPVSIYAQPGATLNLQVNRYPTATGIVPVTLTMTGQILDAGSLGSPINL